MHFKGNCEYIYNSHTHLSIYIYMYCIQFTWTDGPISSSQAKRLMPRLWRANCRPKCNKKNPEKSSGVDLNRNYDIYKDIAKVYICMYGLCKTSMKNLKHHFPTCYAYSVKSL